MKNMGNFNIKNRVQLYINKLRSVEGSSGRLSSRPDPSFLLKGAVHASTFFMQCFRFDVQHFFEFSRPNFPRKIFFVKIQKSAVH